MAFTDDFTHDTDEAIELYSAKWKQPSGGSSTIDVDSANNRVRPNGGTAQYGVTYYDETFNSKHYAEVDIAYANNNQYEGTGPGIRIQTGADSGYYCIARCRPNSGNVRIYVGQYIAGSNTHWEQDISGFNVGDRLGFEIDSATETTVHLMLNDVIDTTYTSKSALSGGKAGLSAYVAVTHIHQASDNWEGGDIGGGGSLLLRNRLRRNTLLRR